MNKNNTVNKVYLNVRVSNGRNVALRELAKRQEKTLTQVIEEAIDAYVKPQLLTYNRENGVR